VILGGKEYHLPAAFSKRVCFKCLRLKFNTTVKSPWRSSHQPRVGITHHDKPLGVVVLLCRWLRIISHHWSKMVFFPPILVMLAYTNCKVHRWRISQRPGCNSSMHHCLHKQFCILIRPLTNQREVKVTGEGMPDMWQNPGVSCRVHVWIVIYIKQGQLCTHLQINTLSLTTRCTIRTACLVLIQHLAHSPRTEFDF